MGITNMIATIPGFLGPSVVGAFTYKNVSQYLFIFIYMYMYRVYTWAPTLLISRLRMSFRCIRVLCPSQAVRFNCSQRSAVKESSLELTILVSDNLAWL